METHNKSANFVRLHEHKQRVQINRLLGFFYDSGFNYNNTEIFRGYVLATVANASEQPIQGLTFRHAAALTIFAYELHNLYLTYRDAYSMLDARVHELDVEQLEKLSKSIADVPMAFWVRVYDAYNARIKVLEGIHVESETNGEFSGQFVVEDDKIVDLHMSAGSIIMARFSFIDIPRTLFPIDV